MIIEQYLTIETNYALIINGKYGIGKTHYFKEILTPKIKEVPTPHNASKKYFPIHISLFGLKSVEEIHTAIFMEIYPFLNNAGIKLGANVFKLLVRGAAAIKGINIEDNVFKDLNPENIKSIDYDKLVICFDDLDRKSEDLKLNDVFGFINSLVENEGTKILIITNDEQLIKESKEIYEKVKEKVVGVSIEFEQEIDDVFNEITNSKYKGEDLYYNYLSNNSSKILKVVKDNDNNLRTLIFFLEHFRSIYSSLEVAFQENEKFNFRKQEKNDAVLIFCLAIIFEYKSGRLNANNFKDLQNLNNVVFWKSILNNSNNENVPDSYIEKFRSKYFPKNNFYYFDSLFQFIIGKKSFCIETLKIELIEHFGELNTHSQKQNNPIDRLGYMDCFSLSQQEYRNATFEMLRLAYKGGYSLDQYPVVFHYATRFENMLNLNIPDLKNKLKSGIKKYSKNVTKTKKLNSLLSLSQDTEYYEDVKEIVEFCFETNQLIKLRLENEKINQISIQNENNFWNYIEMSSHEDADFYFKPFWHKLNFYKIAQEIIQLENHKIWELSDYFNSRYKNHSVNRLVDEKDFVLQLKIFIEQKILRIKTNTLRKVSLKRLEVTIDNCYDLFSE